MLVALGGRCRARGCLRACCRCDHDFEADGEGRDDRDAPIVLRGGGRISTVSGGLPPRLETISIEFDRHGSVVTTGLPTCSVGRLIATTTKTARKLCPGAIVGSGFGKAQVKLPEQAPFPVSSPITLFNGRPKDGDPTVLAHAHLTQPVPTTFVIPIVIERIHKGIYGYRTKTTIPSIADGAGIPVAGSLRIGRRWTYRGHRYSYVNARCADRPPPGSRRILLRRRDRTQRDVPAALHRPLSLLGLRKGSRRAAASGA